MNSSNFIVTMRGKTGLSGGNIGGGKKKLKRKGKKSKRKGKNSNKKRRKSKRQRR